MDEPAIVRGIPIPQEGDPRLRWFCPKPTVRILFYTDDDYISLDEDIDAYDFGVRILHDLLVHDDSDRATFEIDLVNRHEGGHAANKLTPDRLATYDQVWFFGHRQANTSSETQNELVDSEVTALGDWMTAGGVLMTGDHSNPRPNGADPGLTSLLGLGRAIGHKVPRAGSLRVWDGGPPQYAETSAQENYNTQVPTPDMQPPTDPLYPPNSPAIEGLDPQEDEWPQNLILTTYPVPGDPLSFAQPYGRRVHELFCGRTRPITVFPDHMHEGQLILPKRFLTSIWPQGTEGQPRPEAVARGTDKRNGRVYDLVMAYDGSSAGAGRIVADSTWHHYFNVNLKGFPDGGYVLAALAQFYANLAVWLSPPAKRWQIACWLRWKLVHNPNVLMTYGNSRMALGRVAAGVLRKTAGPCVIREVLEPLAFASAGSSGAAEPEPPAELMLGGVVEAHLDALRRVDAGDEAALEADADALVRQGLRAAHADHAATLAQAAEHAARALTAFDERLRDQGHAQHE